VAKILYVSDSPTLTTGYGRVSKELTVALHNAGHEITVLGWGYMQGEQHPYPFNIIPCNAREERHGENKVAMFIREQQPDIVFTLGDPWMVEYMPTLEERKAVCWINYFPIDGYPIPPEWHSLIRNCDIPVVFSKFAFDLVKPIIGKDPVFIPHGVDTSVFRPLSDKEEIRSRVLGESNKDKFIVGCVARNQPRKNIPALVKAFAEFSKNKPDVALYLHMAIRDVGWNIDELVHRFGVAEKTYSTNGYNAIRGVTDEQLCEVYNMFDIFALPTMAEGFGLPILEAQSCGTPVLVTDFSACTELTVSRQELIKVKDTLIMGRNIEQAIADTDDLTRKLNYFYNDWNAKKSSQLKKLGEDGRKKAETMDWKEINESFIKLISKVEPNLAKLDKKIRPNFYRI
jgi:glycosyltransferase involved in cell wall biosynthesis